ncbi:MAG: hypothetical protein QOF43_800, partial [Gaiellaceae bacterium]|nr:hypothetical protein [Gaiellaceae bacterium]
MRALGGRNRILVLAALISAICVLVLPTSAGATAGDGSGTITVAPTYTINSSTGNFFTFTYTAAAGGLSAGEITLVVPAGWSAPDTNGFNTGAINAGCGDSPVTIAGTGPWTVHITNVTLAGGATCDIHYGINGFGTVVAPATAATYTFTTQEKSTAGGTLTSVASQPQIVVGTDGTGTMTVSPASALISSTGNTFTFHYTATRTMTAGQVHVAVPANWSAPSTTGSAPGFSTSTCPGGTVGVVGTTIQVTGINLASAAACDIVYGSTASAGPGATAPPTGGTQAFTTQQESTNDSNLQAIGTSPQVSVVAPDGSGTMTVTPTSTITSSTGNFFTFTYTAAPGGLHNGELTL